MVALSYTLHIKFPKSIFKAFSYRGRILFFSEALYVIPYTYIEICSVHIKQSIFSRFCVDNTKFTATPKLACLTLNFDVH